LLTRHVVLQKRPIDELKNGPGSRDTTPSAVGSKSGCESTMRRCDAERSDAWLSYMYTGALLTGWIVAKKKKV
jgi:hypothetical protein